MKSNLEIMTGIIEMLYIMMNYISISSPKGIPQLSTVHCQLSTQRSVNFQFPESLMKPDMRI